MAGRLGVVVAGGRGRRLAQGMPKALVSLLGETLLHRAVETLAPLCEHVVVVAPAGMAMPDVRATRVNDPAGAEGEGPLAGVVAGLATGAFDQAFVLGVDFPLLRLAFLEALAARLGESAAVVPSPHGVPQPLAAVYAPRAAAALAGRLAAGERSITVAVGSLSPRYVGDDELEDLPGGFENFLNLNSPADLERVTTMLGVRARSGDAA